MTEEIRQLKEWIDGSSNIVFFGGAGVSTESNIPDFRSVDGLYHQSYDYPDTSSYGGDVTTPGWNLKVESHHSNNDAIWCRRTYESQLREDTLIIFVFNADTLSTYGWNYVKNHNIVTQRYYLSLSDLYNLKWCLSFPPTEEMRDIKMWPPYGTYGHNGYRIN